MTRTEELKRQMNDLWKQAVEQIDDMRERVERSRDRIEADIDRLRHERDRLLKRIGEQTHRLAHDGTLPMPAFVKSTVNRFNDVLDSMMTRTSKRRKKAPPARKPRSARRKAGSVAESRAQAN